MISKKEALLLYRKLLLARKSEEKIMELYPKDEIKSPVHLGIGQEAIPVGVCHVLPKGAKFFGTYRNHVLYLALTGDTDGFFAELYGKSSGIGKGKAGSMHLMAPDASLMATSAVVGTTIPVAVGAALASVYRNSKEWVAVFFGDGAMEEGVFWESLNFACLHHLPILFICEDNELAIHATSAERRGFKSISDAVSGFDCHCGSGNGTDVLEVIARTKEVFAKMKTSLKPAFLDFSYFRFLEHVGVNEDFEAGYRKRPSARDIRKLDPVITFAERLSAFGCASSEIESVESALDRQINRSVEKAQAASFPLPGELYTDVFV